MPANYIEGRNPFKLVEPSPWWLQLLSDYDPLLVVMPSVKDHAYRLCRRVPRHAQLGNLVKYLHTHPDTVQMINNGLVPVSTITPWAIQSDKIIRDLMSRDTERVGGADGTLKVIEASEARAIARRDKKTSSDLNAINGEAFRSLQFRNGSAVALGSKRLDKSLVDKRDLKTVSSGRTKSGLVTPRDPAQTSPTARPTLRISLTDPG